MKPTPLPPPNGPEMFKMATHEKRLIFMSEALSHLRQCTRMILPPPPPSTAIAVSWVKTIIKLFTKATNTDYTISLGPGFLKYKTAIKT